MKKKVWTIAGLAIALMGALTLADAGQEKQDQKGNGIDKGGRPDREKAMKKYDLDGDGRLSDEELALLKKDRETNRAGQGGERPNLEEMLKKFDADGDGQLNETERAALRKEMGHRKGGDRGGPGGERPNREEMTKKFDADGDGQLNETERAAMREAFEARRHEDKRPAEQEK